MTRNFLIKRVLILLMFSYVFFFFGNNFLSLTDPDEVFYSLTAKEMAAKSEWMTPYIFNHPQFEKPIFTYWMLRIAFEWWGETPFSARFFPAIFASLGVLGIYALGWFGFRNERKAFWSALVLSSSAFYIAMGKTVFTDMIFSVFIMYSLLSFYFAYSNPKQKVLGILGFYFFAAFAVLTKGPLGLAIPGLASVLFLLYIGQIQFLRDRIIGIGFLLFLIIALPWYAFTYIHFGQAFIQEFFYNDHWRRLLMAEHRSNDRWFFYPLTMFGGVFPWSLFLFGAFLSLYKKLKWKASAFEYFLLSWILICFIIFQSAHSKLTSYILPLFPALALLTGGFIEEQLTAIHPRLIRIFVATTAGLVLLLGVMVITLHSLYEMYVPEILPGYFCSAFLICFSGLTLTFVLKDRLRIATALLSVALLPLLWTAFLIKGDIEPYISSFEVSHYLPHVDAKKLTLLSAKPYARGLRYYTGQDVAVLNINGGNYFSAHPIPILSNIDQLVIFLRSQEITYAVVKKSGYQTLKDLPREQYNVQLIKKVGYNYILSIEPLLHS